MSNRRRHVLDWFDVLSKPSRECSPAEKLVLLYLSDRQGKREQAWPSTRRIACELGIALRHVYRALRELELAGEVEIYHRNDDGDWTKGRAPAHSNRVHGYRVTRQALPPAPSPYDSGTGGGDVTSPRDDLASHPGDATSRGGDAASEPDHLASHPGDAGGSDPIRDPDQDPITNRAEKPAPPATGERAAVLALLSGWRARYRAETSDAPPRLAREAREALELVGAWAADQSDAEGCALELVVNRYLDAVFANARLRPLRWAWPVLARDPARDYRERELAAGGDKPTPAATRAALERQLARALEQAKGFRARGDVRSAETWEAKAAELERELEREDALATVTERLKRPPERIVRVVAG